MGRGSTRLAVHSVVLVHVVAAIGMLVIVDAVVSADVAQIRPCLVVDRRSHESPYDDWPPATPPIGDLDSDIGDRA